MNGILYKRRTPELELPSIEVFMFHVRKAYIHVIDWHIVQLEVVPLLSSTKVQFSPNQDGLWIGISRLVT